MVGLGGVALALRLWGIGFGLPALYGPAEHVLVNNALALGTGNPIPLTFQYQPLFSFVLFGGFGVLYLLGAFLGLYQGASEFAVSYLTDPSAVYLTGRGLEALVGAATVVLTYRLGERLFSRKVGVLSGLALAFLPLHAEYSHYTRPDVPTVFFVVLVLISVVSFLDSGRIRHLALAGLWVGLGTATKFPAILWAGAVILAWVAWLVRERLPPWKLRATGAGAAALGAFAAGLLIGFPYLLFEFDAVIRDLMYTVFNSTQISTEGTIGIGALRFGGYLLDPAVFGPTLAGAALVGLLSCAFRPTWARWVTLGAVIVYFVVMSRSAAKFWYILPVTPVLALLVGVGIDSLATWIRRIPVRIGETATVAFVALIVLAPAAASVVWTNLAFIAPDNRNVAKRWIEDHIPPGTRIAIDNYGPQLKPTAASLRARWEESARSEHERTILGKEYVAEARSTYRRLMIEVAERSRTQTYDLLMVHQPTWKSSEAESTSAAAMASRNTMVTPLYPEFFEREGYQYFVTSSHWYSRFFTPTGREAFPSSHQFYSAIEERWELITTFPVPNGPTRSAEVKVYRITPPAGLLTERPRDESPGA
jgi:hypothetical protein